MSSGNDEFDALLADNSLTVEELEVIDAACAEVQNPSSKVEGISAPIAQPGSTTPSDISSDPSSKMLGVPARRLSQTIAAVATSASPVATNSGSLLSLFRKGRLSVTDLVTPTWCEVKFDYSLRGQRWKGAKMDSVVVSKNGKKIPVKKTIVVEAEKIMKKGEAVHKKLEEELPSVEIVIKIQNAEEKLGLEILNMISSLQMLTTIGRCREFRVMGFVNGLLIVGIIDEIVRKAIEPLLLPETPPAAAYTPKRVNEASPTKSPRNKRQKEIEDPRQRKLDAFFSVMSSPTPKAAGPPPSQTSDMDLDTPSSSQGWQGQDPHDPGSSQTFIFADSLRSDADLVAPTVVNHRLHLNDTKTRSEPTLPKDDLSGRLQLMLYYRLLEAMITPSEPVLTPDPSQATSSESQQSPTSNLNHGATPVSHTPRLTFSFQDLFFQRQLTPDRQFSDGFIAQAMEIIHVLPAHPLLPTTSYRTSSPPLVPSSLNNLVKIWWETIRNLGLEPRKENWGGHTDVEDELFMGGPIDPMLMLVYHRRKGAAAKGGKTVKKKRKKGKEKGTDTDNRLLTGGMTESEQLDLAIRESLKSLDQGGDQIKGASLSPPPASTPKVNHSAISPSEPRRRARITPKTRLSSSLAKHNLHHSSTRTVGSLRGTRPSVKYPWDVFDSDDKGETEPDVDVLEQDADIATTLSQREASEWDQMLGESLITDSQLLKVDLSAPSPDVPGEPTEAKSSQDMDLDTPYQSQQVEALTPVAPVPPSRFPNSFEQRVKFSSPVKCGPAPPAAAPSTSPKSDQDTPQIIGRTRFPFSASLIDSHLTAALQFWEGSREPIGVDLEDTWKCNSCEYMEECEWREARASELRPSNAA
ncbi:hypothetical protein FRB94_010667 [Tulasnella sp. JGI-2019a]|nr:hypothetical protein FRB94_010667 [Tulasnella sp. JGI-2019a]